MTSSVADNSGSNSLTPIFPQLVGPKLGYNINSNGNSNVNFPTLSSLPEISSKLPEANFQQLFLSIKDYPKEINWCAHLLLLFFIPASLLIKSQEKENLVDQFAKITNENIAKITDFLNKSYKNISPSNNVSPKNLQEMLKKFNSYTK